MKQASTNSIFIVILLVGLAAAYIGMPTTEPSPINETNSHTLR
jgi:hypothetical protein